MNLTMAQLKCPNCNAPVDSETGEHRPFCSERCQQRDLANWLDEKYGVPYEGLDDEEFDELPLDEPLN